MKKTAMVIISVAAATVVGLIAQQAKGQASRSPAVEAHSTVISKLQEIVAIRERLFESEQVQLQQGRSPLESSAEIDLVEARIQLARERNQRDAVLAELRSLVAAHERRFKRVEPLARDRMPQAALDQIKVGVLEAEVRLLREQK